MLIRALVPAYFDPVGNGLFEWERLIHAAQRIAIVAIANPNSGPGEAPDEGYRTIISRAMDVGITIVGYVATNYGQRPISQVNADVDRWVQYYPQVAGIFFDEQSSSDDAVPHYTELFAWARSRIVNGMIIGNPGTIPSERYTSDARADVECLFESDHGFDTFAPPNWTYEYPDRFCVLPFGVLSTETMERYVSKSMQQGVGTLYITDDVSTDDLPNQWDRLPRYWDEEVEALTHFNHDGVTW